MASEDLMTSLETIRLQQKIKEPALLRFPSIPSLVDPCDFSSSNVFYSEELYASPATWRDLTLRNGGIAHPAALGFIGSNLVDEQFAELLCLLNDARREEEQSSLTKEFKLVVSQALHLTSRIYSPSVLPKCAGYKLESLPPDNLLIGFSTEDIQLQEIYRSLIIVVLHLYAIIRDIYNSARLCPSESLAHLQILRQLIGKVETSMCLVLQSAAIGKRKEKVDYLTVTHEVLQTAIHRYYHCSAR
ncbi:uncharacterized protein LOC124204531 isoform X2 [Daphnia pulex]|nr:uncharacterized protein LOC124204531 isoform X2 [Daphnia pulex]